MPVTLIIMLVLGGLNFVTYGAMYVRERVAVARAVSAEETRGIAICNGRVSQIEQAVNKKVADGVQDALRAGSLVAPTPEGEAELLKLCKGSASCRSRGNL